MIPEGNAIIPISSVKEGTALICDGGFVSDDDPTGFCMSEGDVKVVERDALGNLFVPCRCGQHMLDGQENEDGTYSGFWLASAEVA